MKQKALNTLLTVNNRALQDLHAVFGFDFCAPFDIYQINGRFTVKQIEKMIAADGYDSYNDMVAVCIHDNVCDQDGKKDDFRLVILNRSRVEVDHRMPWHNQGRGLGNFYRKVSFEEARKKETAETIIVVQHEKYVKKPVEKAIDWSIRFKLLQFDFAYTPSKGRYINRLYLQRTDASGQKYNYEIPCWNTYNIEFLTEDIDQTIDKSGYLLLGKRNELKCRATALRAERKKAVFVATDNTVKIEDLQKLINKRHEELVKAFEDATTADEMEKVYDALSVYSGFINIVRNFERLKEGDTKKRYDSVNDFMRDYAYIRHKLTAEAEA